MLKLTNVSTHGKDVTGNIVKNPLTFVLVLYDRRIVYFCAEIRCDKKNRFIR